MRFAKRQGKNRISHLVKDGQSYLGLDARKH
jgi:hypothetical protein